MSICALLLPLPFPSRTLPAPLMLPSVLRPSPVVLWRPSGPALSTSARCPLKVRAREFPSRLRDRDESAPPASGQDQGRHVLDSSVSVLLAGKKKKAKELLSGGRSFGDTRDGNTAD